MVTLGGIAEILGLLGGSEWDVTDPKKSVILDAVEASYAPFIWNGRMMETVRGRAVSRQSEPDYVDGAAAITAILLLAQGAGEPYRGRYLSLVKGWLQRCTDEKLYGLPTQTVAKSLLVTSILGDDSVTPGRPAGLDDGVRRSGPPGAPPAELQRRGQRVLQADRPLRVGQPGEQPAGTRAMA